MHQTQPLEFSAQTTRAIFDGIVSYGAASSELLSLSSLTYNKLDTDTTDKHLALWLAGGKLLNCPDIGLQVGSLSNPLEGGIIGAVFSSSKNLRMGLDNAIQYIEILVDYIHIDITNDDKYVYINYSYSKGHFHRYGLEHISAAFVNWMRVLLGQHVSPVKLLYQFSKPVNLTPYSTFFGCPIHFEQPQNLIVLSADILKLKNNNFSGYLYKIVKDKADNILNQVYGNSNFENTVSRIISNRLYNGNFAAEDVATSLNMSRRTYFRRLTALGLSHQGLVDTIRKKTAASYLSKPETILKNVPYMLGYADFKAFSRAFKRWTGITTKHFINTISKQ